MRFLFCFILALAFFSPATPAASEEKVNTNAYARGDFESALREWSSLARRGDKRAQHNIGVLYFEGLGIKQNRKNAIAWFKRAADAGYARSQHNLGWIYESGSGTKRNFEEAQKWYGLAAAQYFGPSVARLGALLFRQQLYGPAKRYLSRAAMLGDASAQFSLATIYDKGLGTTADPRLALRWYRAASNNGSAGASNALAQLYLATGEYNENQIANLMSQTNKDDKEWEEHIKKRGQEK